jgi:hypothetical protein
LKSRRPFKEYIYHGIQVHFDSGRTLTAAQAKARFGVANLRATISDIRQVVEAYGNHEITVEETSTGKTAYGMRSFN